MQALKKRRSIIKGQMTRLNKYIVEVHEETSIEQLKTRVDRATELLHEFNDVEDKIFALSHEENSEMEEFERNYYHVVASLSTIIRQRNTTVLPGLNDSSINNTSGSQAHSSEFKLPRVNMPSFNGDVRDWQSFSDLFNKIVHENPNLSPAQKFQYLKGLLRGDAESKVKHLSVTEANYCEALQILKDRYNRKKPIVNAFIEMFLEQPTIKLANTCNIRKLADTYSEVTRGLKALGERAEQRDPWLVYLAKNKLDEESRQLWSNDSTDLDFPTNEDFIKFLNKRADALDGLNLNSSTVQKKSTFPPKVKAMHVKSEEMCLLCKRESHCLPECRQFKTMSIEDRRKYIKESRRCYNCLNTSHPVFRCKVKTNCDSCKRRHHSLLHIDENSTTDNSENVVASHVVKSPKTETLQTINSVNEHTIESMNKIQIQTTLLPTAVVKVKDSSGESQLCRVLLDSGSQISFMTESCVQRLRLARVNARVSVSGLGAMSAVNTRGKTELTITSRFDDSDTISFSALILTKLTSNLPAAEFIKTNWNFIKDLELADPEFNIPRPIDILIGADQIFKILKGGQIVKDKFPIAQYTLFGWVLAGEFHTNSTSGSPGSTINMHIGIDIDRTLRKFWEVEEMPTAEIWSLEEIECENHFQRNVSQLNGKFMVRLPFKNEELNLGDSLGLSIKRLYAMERRFEKEDTFKTSYINFMREYESLGHMKQIPDNEIETAHNQGFYFPHHGVVKESSSTTKLRVVFDASVKTKRGSSLNDNLMVGPTIQPGLLNILLRFRIHQVVFTADIEKMYRQVLIDERDANFQRIVWREDTLEKIKHYRLHTVTYGTACAPYLATRVIQQISRDSQDQYPEVAKIIEKDFYVDDLLSGAESEERAMKIQSQLIEILKKSGFHLRKWSSNYNNLLQNIPESDRECGTIELGEEDSTIKVLGLEWRPVSDEFAFKIRLDVEAAVTKRTILSEAARIFDPLGWLSPTTILIKIFFQQLWLLKLEWDEVLPEKTLDNWRKLRSQIPELQEILIPRWLNTKDKPIELHGFSDASEKAYAAVVYCRTEQEDGSFTVNIVAAKTKVAPLQQVSLPRLELCGAVLLARLLSTTKDAMNIQENNIYAWTDSTIVLSWLSSHPRRWKTYVANRVGEILRLMSRNQWNHVRSCNNPADCASRGIFPSGLKSFTLWWHGPNWLSESQSTWIIEGHQEDKQQCLEELKNPVSLLSAEQKISIYDELASRVSSYNKMLRILAWIQRYLHNYFCEKEDRIKDELDSKELRSVIEDLMKHIQNQYYFEELKMLKTNKMVSTTSSLKMLSPIIDENGILRVGGRIQNSLAPFETKHPIILPGNNEIVLKMIMEEHIRNYHAGATLLFNTLRQRFWIVGCRNAVRRVVHNCVICTRYKKSVIQQQMGSLPESRVKFDRPFLSTGVDYAGPIMLKNAKGRGQRSHKGYIAIFVCMSTKAAHIELVNELTSESFIGALRRFVARRGLCTDIFSDNGSNFIGANRALDQINWHFIPPTAANFGGLWEGLVKSMKFHLRRVLGDSILTYEEMSTLLAQIEAVLNSRPICSTSNEEIDALTPGHFLIGHPYNFVPGPDLTNKKISTLSRWQMVQQMLQHFWMRWQSEYLTALQKRNKWQFEDINLKINDIVVIKEENLPPSKYLLGKVEAVHPGMDGLVRVASIKTKNGILKRPVNKLCLLPIH